MFHEGLRRRSVALVALFVAAMVVVPPPASAGPITFLSALPVTQGQGIFRIQGMFMAFGEDPLPLDRDLGVRAVPLAVVYGATPKLALFAVAPVLSKELELDTPVGRRTRDVTGLGDMTFLARYTIVRVDSRAGTFRIAPFAGVEAPTGEDDDRDALGRLPPPLQLGSGSWDPKVGLVVTRQTLGWELDTAVSYQANREANGFEFGDELRWDASYQHRVWPRQLGGGVPGFLYAVLESNVIHQRRSEAAGLEDPDSGGTVWFVAPGVQYVRKRFGVESVVQIPVAQDLNGSQVERDPIVTVSLRVNF